MVSPIIQRGGSPVSPAASPSFLPVPQTFTILHISSLDSNPSFCFRSDYQGKNLLVEFLCGSSWTWDLQRIWHVLSLIPFEWCTKHAQRCFRLFQEHTYQDSLGHDVYLCIQVKMVCAFSSLMSSPGRGCYSDAGHGDMHRILSESLTINS